ncbi:MAG: adenylosuccinate synthase [Armatimonadota bacterium]|nr:MAG: adenylosuccinate synthase [Armatimonadota bacterium]
MPATVVVGSQWGDEGKGRVVDLLAAEADVVARYNGGGNAGHTVWVGDQKYAVHLVPMGVLRGKLSLLGAGMVIDLNVLLEEESELGSRGIPVRGNIRISENAHLILPYHRLIEAAEEERRGKHAIGTTRRGIGPAYEDKAARRGIRMGDLRDPDALAEKLDAVVNYKNLLLKNVYKARTVDRDEIYRALRVMWDHFGEAVCDTSLIVQEAVEGGQHVLFEGAHGTMLDIDWGTYPYVTSSNPLSGEVVAGAGIGPKAIDRVVGAAKAYTSRVGLGPFPTELEESVAQKMREPGGEFGSTTGRARRIGWFDAMVVRKSVRLNGIESLAITHLDVLGPFEEIPVCVGYRCDGEDVSDFPNQIEMLMRCEPVYETLPGWQSDISHVRKFADLPQNAKAYLKRIEELVGAPVSQVLVGRQRDQSILV